MAVSRKIVDDVCTKLDIIDEAIGDTEVSIAKEVQEKITEIVEMLSGKKKSKKSSKTEETSTRKSRSNEDDDSATMSSAELKEKVALYGIKAKSKEDKIEAVLAADKLVAKLMKKPEARLIKLGKANDIEIKIDGRLKKEEARRERAAQQLVAGGYTGEEAEEAPAAKTKKKKRRAA